MRIGLMPSDSGAPFAQLKAQALAAEASGFASLWVADHLIFRSPGEEDSGIWEAFTLLAGLAAVTEHIQIGPLVACTSFRNPALLAKIADTLDEISGGRSILGLGAGWHQPEYDAYGYPFDHLAGRFEESLRIALPLLRGETVTFQGEYAQAQQARLIPHGPSLKGPPIWIGARKPRMLRLIAQYADAFNAVWHVTPEPIAQRFAEMAAICQEVGRDPATLTMTAGTQAYILSPGETAKEGERAIAGSQDEVIAAFQGFAAVGVQHLVVVIPDTTEERIASFAPVIAALKDA
jgi:alkanesulfonate monooxygenase SsuD/methylene tetrahydromethanopterin reductase-like flavin-dependent oxidoreductase (luciferase family)